MCDQKGGRTAYVSLLDTLCTAYIITEFCTISNFGFNVIIYVLTLSVPWYRDSIFRRDWPQEFSRD